MQLAYSAWAFPRLPIERQVAIVRDQGYVAIELVSGAGYPLDACATDAAERRRIRRLVDDAGLRLVSVAGHADPIEPDPDKRAANLARLRAGLDLVADLRVPCLVAMGYGKPETYEADRHKLADVFGELARYAEARGVVLALEPHVGQAIDLPEKVTWLLDAVGSPHFRLNFDNSHFECMGRDVDEYVPPLVPFSVHTHLKDQRHGSYPNHQFLVPGEGDFDYPRYLRAMQAAGYRGAVTVEISVMVQRRPDYDPAEVAARSFGVLLDASERAGVPLEHR
ncbi:MAG TPA: sugar phosphate isomerase/epimerase [Chloroflexota bacterium]|nr:sugar phosphate isomerase/epimerase [Chloroflexota bacterium]